MSATLRDMSRAPTAMSAPDLEEGGAATRARGPLDHLGDVAALAPVAVALLWLPHLDGGRGIAGTWPLALAAALALPAVTREVGRLPRFATWALSAWCGGLVLGVVAAVSREHMILPLLQYTIAPIVVLAARRVWRRDWAPPVLLLLLVVAFGRYQYEAWSVWWVQTTDGEGLWRTLSWRNQSAALTGMFGVWFLGAALSARRLVRFSLAGLAATSFAGMWLSSSRAGVAVGLGAAVVAVALGARSAGARGEAIWRPILAVVGTAVLSLLVVLGLLAMQPSGSATPIGGRDQGLAQNGLARVEHTGAALGMLADRPVTGQGLGSYRALMQRWNDPQGNLTTSAHNEYAEVAGEAGVLAGGALLAVLLGACALGLRLLRDPPTSTRPEDLRGPLAVGGVATLGLLLVHSGLDFDWNYPVLTSLAGIGLAIALPTTPRRSARTGVASVAVVGLPALLAVGLVGAVVERTAPPAPWNASAHLVDAREALDEGRLEDARAAADRALRWNPASSRARALSARADYLERGDADALAAVAHSVPHDFAAQARAAVALAEGGDVAQARSLADEVHAALDARPRWGLTRTRLVLVEADVVSASVAGCIEAVRTAEAALADPDRPLPESAPQDLARLLTGLGCD